MTTLRHNKKKLGICYDCQEDIVLGKSRCAKHLKSNYASTASYAKSANGKVILENYHSTGEYKSIQSKNTAKWKRNNHFKSAKIYAKQRGKDWTLSEKQYNKLINDVCFYCSHENGVETGVGLDRLDNTRGYHIDNVVNCCALCNYTRADRFSVEEMKLLGKVIHQVKLVRSN